MEKTELDALARELLGELIAFVESDGDTSYLSTEEKEDQHHMKQVRALIARAQAALPQR